ncbi:anoctamin-7 [Pelobates cultripes]|uniref:Anoctamin n=1 Tax=Pelobates cultripes TaxID=61616 RepID=A0AAD1VTI1_PELCU|nr:anoctamin-7 [Pelobates cultripes]
MSVWSVTFLEYWKRYNATLSYRWDCLEFTEIEEPPRPEFTALAPLTILNPITKMEEPYFPKTRQLRRVLAGSMVIVLMIAIVIIFLISVILYRIIIFLVVVKSGMIYSSASLITSVSSSVLSLIITLILSRIYVSLAHFLTQWEMHRTETQYEDAFTFKVFIFEFVNYYSTPIYIAFLKGRFLGYPGNETTIFRYRNENCKPGGCLIELAQQMLIIMVGKQVLNNIKEFLFPKLELCWHRMTLSSNKDQKNEQINPWERDYQMITYKGLFDEYLEMVIQFGFITIFVAACPLAPLFALLNNWIEVRLDAKKFACEYRRPVATRAQDIGIWMSILEAITSIAVIGNAFLVAFTSDILPRAYYQYKMNGNLTGYINFTLANAPEVYAKDHSPCRYQGFRDSEGNLSFDFWVLMVIRLAFVIVFEHVVFFLGRMIDFLVPDVPESVEIKLKRERFLAKQALAENEFLAWTLDTECVIERTSPDMEHEGSNLSIVVSNED